MTIEGTAGDDRLVAVQTGNTIASGAQTFNAAAVNRIVFTGLGGNDILRNSTAKPSTMYGGTGDDLMYGGPAVDIMYGGAGNDLLNGNTGNDILRGGGGTNRFTDRWGKNVISPATPPAAQTNTAIEAAIIQLVNVERISNGLPPLTANLLLNRAGGLHTFDMISVSNRFGPAVGMQHTLYGTARPHISDRLDAVGYDTWTSWYTYGENIAYGYASAAAVMTAWMNSSGHRANILNANFREIGVAVAADAAGRPFFTQVFGRQE